MSGVKALLEKLSSDFKKNLATSFVVRCKVMNKKTGKYEGKNLNAVATAEHYYSLKKNQNHYRIAKYLSQELKISATLKSLLLDLNVLKWRL